MYSFFELSGSQGARFAVAAAGSLIITAVMMVSSVVPASPAAANIAVGALA